MLKDTYRKICKPPDSQTTRGRTRRAPHPPLPPPPVLIQSAEGPIAQPSLSAGRRLLFQCLPKLFWELFWLTTTPQMATFVILADHQAPWQLCSPPACPATWPSGELCLSQVLLVGMLPEASRKGIAQTHHGKVVFISSRSTFRSWEPSQERSLVLLEGLITSSR